MPATIKWARVYVDASLQRYRACIILLSVRTPIEHLPYQHFLVVRSPWHVGCLNAPGTRYDHLGVTRGKELNCLLVALEAMDLNDASN